MYSEQLCFFFNHGKQLPPPTRNINSSLVWDWMALCDFQMSKIFIIFYLSNNVIFQVRTGLS